MDEQVGYDEGILDDTILNQRYENVSILSLLREWVVIVYNVMWPICQVRHGQNKVMFFLLVWN